ncbi:hypothetical protein PIB30_050486 [Stylosanthes scabra]|uniref:Ribonuclease H1 N-terminal domain-containing protein n=1 Tax=Stylosanthes scabra TaxID=79078 RepID=A0ABU6YF16_9FABA|nr:hypothetical protein [Stylosanthes scabra]
MEREGNRVSLWFLTPEKTMGPEPQFEWERLSSTTCDRKLQFWRQQGSISGFGIGEMDGGKYSHYAVRVGRVPGIYRTWEEADEHVLGFSGAQFKGFKSLQEAITYMKKETKEKRTMKQTLEQLTPQMHNLGVGSSQQSFTESGVVGSVSMATVRSTDVQFVPETQGGGFLIVEVMELYLLRACMKLEVGSPTLERRLHYSHYGGTLFSFSAALRCEE